MIEGGEVLLRAGVSADGNVTAGYGGLATCGSVWACPVCSAKIATRRAGEIERLLGWNAERGGSVALATFTMRHHRGQRLRTLRQGLSRAWRYLTQHRAWKQTRRDLGCDGYVRAIECTYGENGWHLHVHLLVLFDGPLSAAAVEAWTDTLYRLWSAGLERQGLEASRTHGVDVRQGSNARDGLDKYLSKMTFEAVGGRFKQGRKGGRTPFEVLADALATGNVDDFDVWWQWERESAGMRQITWSRGLKARVGVDDRTDEEIAAEEDQGETVARITPASWRGLYWRAAELLTVTEQGGTAVALAWLEWHGYVFEEGPGAETGLRSSLAVDHGSAV